MEPINEIKDNHTIVRRFTRPRILIWLGITIAVAIWLSLTDPSRQQATHSEPYKPHENAVMTAVPPTKKP